MMVKKKDIIQLVKDTINEVGADAYGDATLTSQGQYKSRFTKTGRPPGVMEDENLKEFTDYGQEGIYPKKEKPGDMFQQKEVEDLFPNGMASRSNKAFQDRLKKHADWTEQSAYNNTFVHMQYHETKGLEDEYFIYQTQHFNGNYEDFRNPKFTMLSITKNKGTEKEEDLGSYIVDTNAYIDDLDNLRATGNLGDRVMESLDEAHPLNKVIGSRPYSYIGGPTKGQYVLSGPMNDSEKETIIRGAEQAGYIAKPNMGGGVTIFLKPPAVMDEAPMFRTGIKMDMAPEVMAPRIKKVFDMVNGAKSPVQTPEFWKNFFKSRYGIPFPENLKNITKKQALAMNKFGNDMKNNIKEDITDDISKAEDEVAKAKAAVADAESKVADAMKKKADAEKSALEEDNMDHDNEGRMAKSQMYKMKTYVDKLSQMLSDGAQLPAWVQAKLTKASSMMSSVYHYLDYEMVRAQDSLMEHMDKYKKRAVLMEGAMKKFFEMFDEGMTDEEVVQEYARRGTQIPETFIGKARKQYEGLKRMKLELEMSEKEYKNSATKMVNNAEEGYGMEEEKQLASGLKNEKLDPVGKEDDDIDNDGDVDKTDKYLANRRKAVSKAINKQKKNK